MKAKICALWLIDEKRKSLKIRATQALSQGYLKERDIKIGEGVVGLVAKERKPMIIENVLDDKRYKEKGLARKEGLVSMVSVPMMVKNRVIGVINCYTVSLYKFTKSDVKLLSTVANQAAVAIENTELIVKTRVIQEELEIRKKVERAKGILMKERNFDEDQAYNLIRRSSMDKRVPMKDIAEAIILAYEIRQKN
jgi:signal transduction protein with GAF and PtsI domain